MSKYTKIAKSALCLALCIVISFSFAGCSSKKLTEDNVTKTINNVQDAFIKFNIATIQKHVRFKSENLPVDVKVDVKNLGGKAELIKAGKAIFENLKIEVVSIDIESKTAVVNITNKTMYKDSTDFFADLKSNYSLSTLIANLSDDKFIEDNVPKFMEAIDESPVSPYPKQVTLKIEQDKRNIVLVFDDEAQSALTGGVTSAAKDEFISR